MLQKPPVIFTAGLNGPVCLCLPPVGGWSPSVAGRSLSLRWRWWWAAGTPCPGRTHPDHRSLRVPWRTTGQKGREEQGKKNREGVEKRLQDGQRGHQRDGQTDKQATANENVHIWVSNEWICIINTIWRIGSNSQILFQTTDRQNCRDEERRGQSSRNRSLSGFTTCRTEWGSVEWFSTIKK